MASLSVLLADSHEIVRLGLRRVFHSTNRFQVVAEASDGHSVLIACESLHPALVVTELSLARLGGAQLISRILATAPGTRVLVVTSRNDEASIESAFSAGAMGLVLKHSPGRVIADAAAALARGDTYIDPQLPPLFRLRPMIAPRTELSPREQQVVTLVAMGYSNKEIAATACVSVKTVETYRARAFEKLGIASRHALVRYAIDHGWLNR